MAPLNIEQHLLQIKQEREKYIKNNAEIEVIHKLHKNALDGNKMDVNMSVGIF